MNEAPDIDAFRKEIAETREEIRQARLAGSKRIDTEKQNRRQEIINKAQHDLNNHIQAQQAKLDGYALPAYQADFAGALKGRKTIESLQSAANDCLANAKIDISQQADEGAANIKAYKEHAAGYEMLFSDLQQNLFKAHDDFVAMVKLRVAEHKQKEAEKLEAERERIRQEEADKAALAEKKPEPQPEPDDYPLAAEKPAHAGIDMASGKDKTVYHTVNRPSNAELTQVIANHYGVKPIVAAGWLKEMAVAA
jgi:hypothetical protein